MITQILSSIELHKQILSPFFEREVSLEQRETIQAFEEFVRTHPACLQRTHLPGHVTASSVVLSQDRKNILLTFHAKIKKWMQLGGHADGNPHLDEVAKKEAQEESGIDLVYLPFFSADQKVAIPFDFDIHEIPAHGKEVSHFHYDARYVVIALDDQYTISSESLDLKWVPIEQISSYTQEESIHRLIRKLPYLFHLLDRDLFCSFQP